jgi:hypothetical protein
LLRCEIDSRVDVLEVDLARPVSRWTPIRAAILSPVETQPGLHEPVLAQSRELDLLASKLVVLEAQPPKLA